jgi:HNH endonuclease
MSISSDVRALVRQRAQFRCEYCGVSESDTAGELTVDHYRPQGKGGTDELTNLLYCCQRCNQYKSNYWPQDDQAPVLWNPRQEPHDMHFVVLADGTIYPQTSIGFFTMQRLRLNRPPLVTYRQRQQMRNEEARVLAQFHDVVSVLEQMQRQQAALLEEQRTLLEEQRALILLLLEQQRRPGE